MTEDQKKRLEELEAKADEEFEKGEWNELDRLRDILNSDNMEAIQRPRCCEAVVKYPPIHFYVDCYDDSNLSDGKWYTATNGKLTDHERSKSKDVIVYIKNRPEPKFCPYCATPLPKMVRKNPAPEGICTVSDGGYYCDTCSERLNGCRCLPMSAAFEPER